MSWCPAHVGVQHLYENRTIRQTSISNRCMTLILQVSNNFKQVFQRKIVFFLCFNTPYTFPNKFHSHLKHVLKQY